LNAADQRARLAKERRAVLEYLALKALANKKNVLQALYEYLVLNTSPSEAAKKYGINKTQLKSTAYQLMSKGRPALVVKLMKLAWPYIMEIEPLVENNYCKACNSVIHTNHAEPHIAVRHQDIIQKTALEVERKLKEAIKAKKQVVRA